MSGAPTDPRSRDQTPDTDAAAQDGGLTMHASRAGGDVADSDSLPGGVSAPVSLSDSTIERQERADAEAALVLVRSGKLRVADQLGEGGAGVVRAGTDRSLKREVAVKALRAPQDPSARVRFVDEAQITGQLQHPNIVPVYELAIDDDGAPVLLMKRVHGRTLREVIADAHDAARPREPLNARDQRHLLESFIKVCDAIEFAHSKRILHRDVKPDNVMVGEFGEVLVMDWGLAKPIGSLDEFFKGGRKGVISDRRLGEVELTMQGALAGTLPYMAPEQAEGRNDELDETADIYALGAILYTIVANAPPFVGGNALAMQRRVIAGDFPRPSERAPDRVPPELEAITLKAMGRSRRQRYASVVGLREDVERFLDGRTVSVARYSLFDRMRKWVDANRGLSIGIAATLVALLIGGAVALVNLREADMAKRDREMRQAEADAKAAQLAERAAIEERKARELQIRNLVQAGEIDTLAGELGVALQERYEVLIDEFQQMVEASEDQGIGFDLLSTRLREGRLDEFLDAYDTLLAEHQRRPEHVTITADHRVDVAHLLIVAKRDLAAAREHLDHAFAIVSNRDDQANLFTLYGLSYGVEKRYEDALPHFLEAVAIEPERWEYHYNLAVTYRGLERFDDALRRFDEAAALAPNGQAVCARGALRVQLGDELGGMADLDLAVQLEPDNPAVLTKRAQVLLNLGNPSKALVDISRALALTPDDADRHIQRGRSLGALGRHAEALREFAIAAHLAPTDPWPHFYRGHAMRQFDDKRLAIESFSTVIRLDPDHVEAHYCRGIVYMELHEPTLAEPDFTTALAGDPENHEYRFMRCASLIAQHRYEQALPDLDTLIEADPTNWQALVNRGVARAGLGEQDVARTDFERAKQVAPAHMIEAIETLEADTFDD